MSKITRPYSRVYWEALDDPKFADVWDDDHALAAWLRLLVGADMAWPASASLYHGVNRKALAKLVSVGLVDTLPAGRYRIHGLDKERNARSESARSAANAKHHPDLPPYPGDDDGRSAESVRPHPARSADGVPSQDEPSKDEPSKDETSIRTDARWDVCLLVQDLTGRPFGYRTGSPVFDTLAADVDQLGAERMGEAYRSVMADQHGEPIDAAGLVFGAHKRLFKIPDAPRPSPKDAEQARIDAIVAEGNRKGAEREAAKASRP